MTEGSIEFAVNKVDGETGEFSGVFVSEQLSDTDMGSKAPKKVPPRRAFPPYTSTPSPYSRRLHLPGALVAPCLAAHPMPMRARLSGCDPMPASTHARALPTARRRLGPMPPPPPPPQVLLKGILFGRVAAADGSEDY